MKVYTKIVLLCVVLIFGSCSSDSGTDSFSKEERALRKLLNNEWEVVESGTSIQDFEDFSGYPLKKEESDLFFDIKTHPLHSTIQTFVGMNKRGAFYLWSGTKDYKSLLDFAYSCTKQDGNRFSGKFDGITTSDRSTDLYGRQVDDKTMKLVLYYPEDLGGYSVAKIEVMLLKRKGSWNERFSVKNIFEMFNYSKADIEDFGILDFERNHGGGDCQ